MVAIPYLKDLRDNFDKAYQGLKLLTGSSGMVNVSGGMIQNVSGDIVKFIGTTGGTTS